MRHNIFWPTLCIFYLLIIFFIWDKNYFIQFLDEIKSYILKTFDVFFTWGAFSCFLMTVLLYISPVRKIKIGGNYATPILTKYQWFSITLCTSTAVGILFWACSEPLYHLQDPPIKEGAELFFDNTSLQTLTIMNIHWTIIPYSIYFIPSIMLSLCLRKQDEVLGFGSVLKKFFSKKCPQKMIDLVDFTCLITLVTGMSVSLSSGIFMLSGAIKNIFSINSSPEVYGIICFLIVACFICSAASGLMKGIRVVSDLNTKVLLLIGIFLFFVGPTKFIVINGIHSFIHFFRYFFDFTIFAQEKIDSSWLRNWSIFYWGSWLSWAPMTGLFLSRLAFGYTVKEMIEVHVFLPSIVTSIWLSIFSGATIFFEKKPNNFLYQTLSEEGPQAVLFEIFNFLPASHYTHVALLLIIFVSFVTAADSNTEAISTMMIKQNKENEKYNNKNISIIIKLIWGISIGIVSWLMVVYTGVEGMKTISYIGGLPALFLIIFFIFGLIKFIFLESKKANN